MRFSNSLESLGGWLLLGLAGYALWIATTVQVEVELCDIDCKNATQSLSYLGAIAAFLCGCWLLWRCHPDRWRHRFDLLQQRLQQLGNDDETTTAILTRWGQKLLAGVLLLWALLLLLFTSGPEREWTCNQAGCSGGGTSISGVVFYFQILPLSAIGGGLWWNADRKLRQARQAHARSQRLLNKLLTRNPHGWICPSRFAQGAGIPVAEAHHYLTTLAQAQQAESRVEKTGEVAYRFPPPAQ